MSLFLITFRREDNHSVCFVISFVTQNNHVLSASVNHYCSLRGFLESSSFIQFLGGEATCKWEQLKASHMRTSAAGRYQLQSSGKARLCCSNKEALKWQGFPFTPPVLIMQNPLESLTPHVCFQGNDLGIKADFILCLCHLNISLHDHNMLLRLRHPVLCTSGTNSCDPASVTAPALLPSIAWGRDDWVKGSRMNGVSLSA